MIPPFCGKPLCEYQRGDVVRCPNCGEDNFYIVVNVHDMYGNMPPSFLFDYQLNPNQKEGYTQVWCRHCSHQHDHKDGKLSIRYACPDCGRTNIDVLEPSQIDKHDSGDTFFCYMNYDTECRHCGSEFVKLGAIHNQNGEEPWWATEHLYRKKKDEN